MRRGLLILAVAFGLTGCVTGHDGGTSWNLTDVQPGYRPAMNTDEAGIWLLFDRSEQDTKTSPARITDPEINQLVGDILCRVAPDHCANLRYYVLRNPGFNATAAGNGAIQVWSGLLLRMRTESELAAVLGHEITHFVRRHSLARARHMYETRVLTSFLNIGVAALGGSSANMDFNNLLEVGEIQSFSRDNERESDELGMERMVKAGYEPQAAADVWKRIMDLQKAKKEMGRTDRQVSWDLYLASHPSNEEREETLRDMAKTAARPATPPPDRLRRALIPIRMDMLLDEVKIGQFRETKALIDMLMPDDPAPGQLLYAMGELHRKRGKENDELEALSFFHEACEAVGAPFQAYRMVGTMRWRRGEKELAREFFRRYLKAAPDAPDRALIVSYLESR